MGGELSPYSVGLRRKVPLHKVYMVVRVLRVKHSLILSVLKRMLIHRTTLKRCCVFP